MLEVKDLKIKLNDKTLVENINFEIESGKVLALVGESGSGKSIICRSILGLNKYINDELITEGKIVFRDVNLLEIKEEEFSNLRGKEISMIFQNAISTLNPLRKIGNQIADIFSIHTSLSKTEINSKVLGLLKDVKLENYDRVYNMYPHELSGGMAQRVVIAIAIALKPKLIIADEPTTSLDPRTQEEILNLLLGLARKNNTAILFVSHDLEATRLIADEIILLKDGEIIESQTVDNFFNSPKSSYAKKLLDCTILKKLSNNRFYTGED